MIKINRKTGESGDRVINNWKKRVQSTGLINFFRGKMFRQKKDSRRSRRKKAVYNANKKIQMDKARLYE